MLVLLFLAAFQEMAQRRAGAYLHYWNSFRSLRPHSCGKDTAQVSPKYLAVLECTTGTATHTHTKDGYTASDPEVVATDVDKLGIC